MSNVTVPFRMYDKREVFTLDYVDAARLYTTLAEACDPDGLASAGLPAEAFKWVSDTMGRLEETYGIDPHQRHGWPADNQVVAA